MSNIKLDKDEKNVIKDYEAGEYISVLTTQRLKVLQSFADKTLKKNKRINIRLSERDLKALQKLALEEGMPYQTLITSILHKYVSGNL